MTTDIHLPPQPLRPLILAKDYHDTSRQCEFHTTVESQPQCSARYSNHYTKLNIASEDGSVIAVEELYSVSRPTYKPECRDRDFTR